MTNPHAQQHTIQGRHDAAPKDSRRKIKPHPVDRMANRQSSGAILANLVSGR
jgi:hypothetical protein